VLKEEEKGEYGDHRGPKLTGPSDDAAQGTHGL
jgi:hypothetical protein